MPCRVAVAFFVSSKKNNLMKIIIINNLTLFPESKDARFETGSEPDASPVGLIKVLGFFLNLQLHSSCNKRLAKQFSNNRFLSQPKQFAINFLPDNFLRIFHFFLSFVAVNFYDVYQPSDREGMWRDVINLSSLLWCCLVSLVKRRWRKKWSLKMFIEEKWGNFNFFMMFFPSFFGLSFSFSAVCSWQLIPLAAFHFITCYSYFEGKQRKNQKKRQRKQNYWGFKLQSAIFVWNFL